MSVSFISPRRLERERLPLPVGVQCRESVDHQWKELAQTLDVSPFGARLQITRPSEPGRLLFLTLPMPRQLRCYDHDAEHYAIWSLVRHAKPLPAPDDRIPRFEIGVAFIGRDAPGTFELDPGQRYDLSPRTNETDLWRPRERATPDDTNSGASERRSEPRHNIADNVVIEIYDAQGQVIESEETRTENISRRGMAVLTTMSLARGRYLRVRSAQYKLAVIAAVRRLAPAAAGHHRLHLEFVDQHWPPL